MSKDVNEDNLRDRKYSDAYSDDSFWGKMKGVAKKVGAKGIYYALILYYVLQKDDVPKSSKALIIGALGYFILPIDLIPDLMPIVGYTDDIAGLLLVVKQVWMYVDDDVKDDAKFKMQEWFDISDDELNSYV